MSTAKLMAMTLVMVFGCGWLAGQETIIDTEPGVPAPVLVAEATLARETADAKERQYLVDSGWQYGYDNPGNMSLWGKVINGKEYRSELDVAVQVQVHLDTQDNQ